MDYGMKSFSKKVDARLRRAGALARLENQLSKELDFKIRNIDNCEDPIAKEALMQGYILSTNRIKAEINTLKGRI